MVTISSTRGGLLRLLPLGRYFFFLIEFWGSYIKVDHIEQIWSEAVAGKREIHPESYPRMGGSLGSYILAPSVFMASGHDIDVVAELLQVHSWASGGDLFQFALASLVGSWTGRPIAEGASPALLLDLLGLFDHSVS